MKESSADRVKQVVREHWNGRADAFDEQATHGILNEAQRAAWSTVLRDLAFAPGLRALDIGCGTGFLSLQLAAMGHTAHGIDLAPAMLARAREKASERGLVASFALGDAEALEASDDAYDLVVERHVIWTLPDPAGALAEWRRVLRPGGRVALIEGDWGSPGHPDYEPIKAELPLAGGQPSSRVVALLEAAGFVDARVTPLMDPNLWGEDPTRERYVVSATAP